MRPRDRRAPACPLPAPSRAAPRSLGAWPCSCAGTAGGRCWRFPRRRRSPRVRAGARVHALDTGRISRATRQSWRMRWRDSDTLGSSGRGRLAFELHGEARGLKPSRSRGSFRAEAGSDAVPDAASTLSFLAHHICRPAQTTAPASIRTRPRPPADNHSSRNTTVNCSSAQTAASRRAATASLGAWSNRLRSGRAIGVEARGRRCGPR